jgi:methyl-accepting chemotaxis protein
MRRVRIGTRLGAAFAAVLALLVGVSAVAFSAIVHQRDTNTQVRTLQLLTSEVKEIRFYAASMSGWQSAYVADVHRLGAARALGGDSVNYKAWQRERDRFTEFLKTVHAEHMTADERALFDKVRAETDGYLALNDKVVAAFKPGTPTAVWRGDQLAMYDSWSAYYRIMTASSRLADSLDARSTAAVAESADAADTAQWVIGVGAALALLLGCALAFAVTRSIVGPVTAARDALRRVADRDLDVTLPADGQDEPAEMAAALDEAVAAVRSVISDVQEQAEALASTSTALDDVASTFASSTGETSAQAQLVAASSQEVSRSVHTVAVGSREMDAAIREVSQSATEAAQVAQDAVEAARTATGTVSTLGDSSAKIGDVVKLITSIAEQTNLLALNATIEAARAGEAGKGFAVVAGEVKELAQETAKATETIGRLVQAIQADTGAATGAIERIGEVIERISEYQTSIAGAVEEQTATAAEMNRSVGEAADGSEQIAAAIGAVAEAASAATADVARSREAAAELTRASGQLRDAVGQFRL